MDGRMTRVLWSVCCLWMVSACAAAEDTSAQMTDVNAADVTPVDGEGAEDVGQPDGATPVLDSVTPVEDGSSPSDSTSPVEDAGSPDDALEEPDNAPEEDVAPLEDTAPEEDSGSVQDAGASVSCDEPNPAGCTQTLCDEGEICDPNQGCKPSSCFCDESTGDWSCSKDCGGGVCVAKEIEETACPGANPAGCANSGCPEGYACITDPAICIPSACSCEESTGIWQCTEDCGGGSCQKEKLSPCEDPDPTSCTIIGCEVGYTCDAEAPGCSPSSCACDEETGGWICTQDCLPGECVPDKPAKVCAKPDPTSCSLVGCADGFFCDLEAPGCGPSSCTCDEASGTWVCTKDCLPGQCVPLKPAPGCAEPNPTSCTVIGCDPGFTCDPEAPGCSPSSCLCDVEAGAWVCSKDCLPGQCVPALEKPCADDELKTPDGCLTCAEVLEFVTADANNSAQSAAQGCDTDEDCVMVQGESGCLGLCPVAVTAFWAEKYVNKIQLVSEAYCQGYQEICPSETPACEPAEAVCVGGTCQAATDL